MPPDDVKLELTRVWLIKADHDLQLAERALLAPTLLDGVMFHCQQAVEKSLKGYLTWHDQSFRKTHNLEELIRQCSGVDDAFSALTTAATGLSPYASRFRCPGAGDDPSAEDAGAAILYARRVVQFVTQRLPPEASA